MTFIPSYQFGYISEDRQTNRLIQNLNYLYRGDDHELPSDYTLESALEERLSEGWEITSSEEWHQHKIIYWLRRLR